MKEKNQINFGYGQTFGIASKWANVLTILWTQNISYNSGKGVVMEDG
jgi:hypothetical protein